MFNKLKLILTFRALVVVSACGGGDDSSGPTVSTAIFNLQAINRNAFTTASSNNFTVSGFASGFPVSGSGKVTSSAVVASTFEGRPAFQRTITVTGTAAANGIAIPLASSGIQWSDSNYLPVGEQAGGEYVVVTGVPTIPTAARVNDTGSLYMANRYTNSTKSTLLGTVAATYVLEADTENTALLTVIHEFKSKVGAITQTTSAQSRVSTSNAYTRIKENGTTPNSILTFTYY